MDQSYLVCCHVYKRVVDKTELMAQGMAETIFYPEGQQTLFLKGEQAVGGSVRRWHIDTIL